MKLALGRQVKALSLSAAMAVGLVAGSALAVAPHTAEAAFGTNEATMWRHTDYFWMHDTYDAIRDTSAETWAIHNHLTLSSWMLAQVPINLLQATFTCTAAGFHE